MFALGLLQLVVHSPVDSQVLDLSGESTRGPLHCTAQLTTGVRIDLGAAPLG